MKKLILWIFCFPIALLAQNAQFYTIQIGTYVNPKAADFMELQTLGYLHAEPFSDKFSKVFLGEFFNEAAANNSLQAVRAKGFSAFLTPRTLVGKPSVLVVQFTTKSINQQIDWPTLSTVGRLYTVLTDPNRLKIVTGPFATMATARKRVADLQQLGYKDAFIKTINTGLLHEVGPFETGIPTIQGNLNAAVDAIIGEGIPTNYEANSNRITTNQNATIDNSKGLIPEIRPLIKRTSSLDLQKILKERNYFNGSLDGFYGKATQAGYQNFLANDFVYKKYALFSSLLPTQQTAAVASDFQLIINNLLANPTNSIQQLNATQTPLAKAYRAYWLLANNGHLPQINQLMNAAIRETFADKKIKNAPPFDFNATYSYENITQFILHLRYLHAAPKNAAYAIPCWLFEQHPTEAYAAFTSKSKFASFANTKIAACTNFDEWPSLKILQTLLIDLAPATHSTEEMEKSKRLQSARNFLYLFPEKLSKSQKKATDQWLIDFWKQLEVSGNVYPVLGKNLATLKVLFFQSQVVLEDYFMNKEFTPDAAEGLALSVLKTYVDVPLGVYGN